MSGYTLIIDGTNLNGITTTGNPVNVVIPEGITYISENTFNDNTDIRSIKTPASLSGISRRVGWGCTSLETVDFSLSVLLTYIPSESFSGCINVKTIYLPPYLNHLVEIMLINFYQLRNIYFTGNAPTESVVPPGIYTGGILTIYRYSDTTGWGSYGNTYVGYPLVSIARPGAGSGSGAAPCFLGNAPVLTSNGYVRMDRISVGDKVMTPEGDMAVVERVKVTTVAASKATNPYVIAKGQFGAVKRLLISPSHRVVVPGRGLVEAQYLGLPQEEREGNIEYYNLELSGEANMVVAGVPVESLAHIRRVTMTTAQFATLMRSRYGGEMTPVLRAHIARTCQFLQNGMVNIPMRSKKSMTV
jgi:hypothetical protein